MHNGMHNKQSQWFLHLFLPASRLSSAKSTSLLLSALPLIFFLLPRFFSPRSPQHNNSTYLFGQQNSMVMPLSIHSTAPSRPIQELPPSSPMHHILMAARVPTQLLFQRPTRPTVHLLRRHPWGRYFDFSSSLHFSQYVNLFNTWILDFTFG